MPTDDLAEAIAESRQEILIGAYDRAICVEFDRCLGPGYGVDFGRAVERMQFRIRNVIGEFDDLDDFSAAILDRIIVASDEDFPSTFGDPLEITREELAIA